MLLYNKYYWGLIKFTNERIKQDKSRHTNRYR